MYIQYIYACYNIIQCQTCWPTSIQIWYSVVNCGFIVLHVFNPSSLPSLLLFPVVEGVWKQKGTVDGVCMTSPALDRDRAALLLTPLWGTKIASHWLLLTAILSSLFSWTPLGTTLMCVQCWFLPLPLSVEGMSSLWWWEHPSWSMVSTFRWVLSKCYGPSP